MADTLPSLLTRHVSDAVDWVVKPVCDPFEATNPDSHRLIDKARQQVQRTNWDVAICLTDVPIRVDGDVLIANLCARDRVALVSLPALGGLWLRRRFARVLLTIVDHLLPAIPRNKTGRRATLRRQPGLPRPFQVGRSSRATILDTNHVDTDGDVNIVITSGWGVPRLLAGMVRANRPWKLVGGLSRALAGALTGAAFGVLYGTIWKLAVALGPLRLSAVTLGAISILVTWVVLGHNLWDRNPRRPHRQTQLLNASTLLTVIFGAVVFCATLYLFTLITTAVVIPPSYLSTNLGRSAGWGDYLRVALMATVLGTVAGAVGSGLEDDNTVRRAAYGYRERERWRMVQRNHTTND